MIEVKTVNVINDLSVDRRIEAVVLEHLTKGYDYLDTIYNGSYMLLLFKKEPIIVEEVVEQMTSGKYDYAHGSF